MRSDLRWNLMIRVGIILAIVLLINFGLFNYFFYQQVIQGVKSQAEVIGKDIGDEVHKSLLVLHADQQIFAIYNDNFERMVKEREDYLVEIALFSPEGKYLASADSSNVGKLVAEEIMDHVRKGDATEKKAFEHENSYAVIKPIAGSDGKTAAYLLISFTRKLYTEPMKKVVESLVATLIGSIVLTGILINLFAFGSVVNPLNRLAKQTQTVAEGDLTHEMPIEGASEIRVLAKSFNEMIRNLQDILLKINAVSGQFTDTCQKLFMLSGEISHGSRLQVNNLNEGRDSLNKMGSNVETISEKVQELNHLSQNASASILEMTASISEVDSNVDNLADMVDEISSSILEITQSAKEVAASVESVAREAESAATSIAQINTSIQEVDSNTTLSASLSAQVAEVAEEGMRSIEGAQEGMKGIRIAVENTASSIDKLGERSTRIGKILGVINKIAEETNLLALNAAIIAAEAGEAGRGFNVVANEIQTLAERTTLQTKEIDTLIRDVQKETLASVQQARNVLLKVEEGERLTSGTATVLQKIKEGTRASQNMIQQIAKATQEQTVGVRRVSESSDKVSSEVRQISKATREQAAGTGKIMEAIEHIKDLARAVQSATREQTEGSKTISKSTEMVQEFVANINVLTDKHRSDASTVSTNVVKDMKIIEENQRRVQDMENAVEGLIQLTTNLNDAIGRFRLSSQRRPT